MRYKSLDGLRGIASVIVLIHHCLIIVPFFLKVHFHELSNNENNLLLQVSHIFWAGHEAVLLFFILSGFVLYNTVQNLKSYKEYFLNRFSRIYVPYMTSIILSASLYILFYQTNLTENQNGFSDWFNTMWPVPIDYLSIVSAVFMTGYNTHSINTVTWSLIHELRISLILPIIVWWVSKNNKLWYLTISIFFLFIANFINMFLIPEKLNVYLKLLLMNFNDTFYYVIFFVVGIYLAINKEKVIKKFKTLNTLTLSFLFFLGLLLILFEWIFPNISKGKYSVNIYVSKISIFYIDMIITLGMIIIFCLVISCNPIKYILEGKILLFLGKISYSLYLIHPIVILCVVHTVGNYLNYIQVVLLSIGCSLIAGTIFYFLIEKHSLMSIRKRIIKFQSKDVV